MTTAPGRARAIPLVLVLLIAGFGGACSSASTTATGADGNGLWRKTIPIISAVVAYAIQVSKTADTARRRFRRRGRLPRGEARPGDKAAGRLSDI